MLQIAPESDTEKRVVDKLARVYLSDGTEQWILIHLEIQSAAQAEFAERVYIYNTLAWLKYRRDVVSIAILVDKNPNWRPTRYERGLAGCRTQFEFVACKVLDYNEARLQAAASKNPAALLMLAFRKAMDTENAPDMRLQARIELTHLALELGYTKEQVQEILRLLEWAMKLPKELEREYRRLLARIKREERTPYLASFEREAIRKGLRQGYEEGKQEGWQAGWQEGRQEGIVQGLMRILEARYSSVPTPLQRKLSQIHDPELLLQLYPDALQSASLEEFETRLDQYLSTKEAEE